MSSLDKKAKLNFEYERDSRSIFSLPSENYSIKLINSMISEILASDFISDFKENFTDNYEKEALLDNIFLNYFDQIEKNLIIRSFQDAFNIINAIFFMLEFFSAWIRELDSNDNMHFFSDLCFYLNSLIISFLSFAFYEKESEKTKIIQFNLERLLSEIENFDSFLKENFNIVVISSCNIDCLKTLSLLDIKDLIKILRTLTNNKIEDDGYCFQHNEYNLNCLIFDPLKLSFRDFIDLSKI